MDATQFSMSFFGALLTGKAVIFALSFSAASSWPALRVIDAHIAFREWLFIGGVATLFLASGLLADNAFAFTYGALLFLLVGALGVFSFVRLFALAGVGGRNKLLRDTLTVSLRRVDRASILTVDALHDDPAIASYLSAVDQVLSGSDPNAVRHLTDQLINPHVEGDAQAVAIVLHLEVLHRLTRAALVGHTDVVTLASCAQQLIASIVQLTPTVPGASYALGATSRQLAWLSAMSLLAADRDPAATRGARELIAMATEGRLLILRTVDPEPDTAQAVADLECPLGTAGEYASWIADFCEYHGAHQADAFFGLYEQITGTKFTGNYRDGDSVLDRLRTALFGPDASGPADPTSVARARDFFGSAEGFNRYWLLVSVSAISTLRDAQTSHPPQLENKQFSPDRQLLGEYLGSFATHRWYDTAQEARRELVSLLAHAETPGSPTGKVRAAAAKHPFPTRVPIIVPLQRPAAMVLAIACRLAPLQPGGSDQQLRSFLELLPSQAQEATAALAARILPDAAGYQDPVGAICAGFSVLQLVDSRLRSDDL